MLTKKRGFTLIELVAVMGILAIILSLAMPYAMRLDKISEDINKELRVMSLVDFLIYSKEYCLINGESGSIRFIAEKNKVVLVIVDREVREIHYEEEYNIYFLRGVSKTDIRVSNKGKLEAGKVCILKEGLEEYEITIGVGVDYIDVKKKT